MSIIRRAVGSPRPSLIYPTVASPSAAARLSQVAPLDRSKGTKPAGWQCPLQKCQHFVPQFLNGSIGGNMWELLIRCRNSFAGTPSLALDFPSFFVKPNLLMIDLQIQGILLHSVENHQPVRMVFLNFPMR